MLDSAHEAIRSLDQELYADFDELRRERARTDDDPGSTDLLAMLRG